MIKRTIVIEQAVRLSTQDEQMVIRYLGTEDLGKKVPIEDLSLVLIEHPQTSLTHQLIIKLMQQNVAVVHCDEKYMPISLHQPLNSHSAYAERLKYQLEASLPLKKMLWQQTITEKILNQFKLMDNLGIPAAKMKTWAKEVKPGDELNHEARAAAFYWSQVTQINGFRRDRELSDLNVWFNYAYSILRSITARNLVSSGLLPVLGIFHRGKYNAYALADDIMEPYRPIVDQWVIDVKNQGYNWNEFTRDVKVKLLQVPTLDVLMESKKSPLQVAMSRTTNSLFECFSGNLRKIRYPELI
jgi:CRISPR-associated protein Cas1